MDKTKRGIVLFVTLSVIVAMMTIIGVMFSYLEQSRERADYSSALIQANLLFSDSKNVITSLLEQTNKDKNMKKGILDMLYLAPISLQTEDTKNFVSLACRPVDNGVNINWLSIAPEDTKNQKLLEIAQNLFDAIAVQYNIANTSALLERIAKNGNFSSQNRQNKGIISFSQLDEIVKEYRYENDDESVIAVPWERYFSFDGESTIINSSYISAETISLLFNLDMDSVKSEWVEGDDLKRFLDAQGAISTSFNSKIFVTNTPERMKCRITYSYKEQSYAFEFKYLEGRATGFDFFAKQ